MYSNFFAGEIDVSLIKGENLNIIGHGLYVYKFAKNLSIMLALFLLLYSPYYVKNYVSKIDTGQVIDYKAGL